MGKFIGGLIVLIFALAIIVGLFGLVGWGVAALLNFILPEFGLQVSLTLWHGVAILVVLSILGGALGLKSRS
jgi:hypothetical protein